MEPKRSPLQILNLPGPYRCFTGLSGPPEVLAQFNQSLAPLRKKLTQAAPPGARLRWTHAQDLHITLEFFQGLSLEQLEGVIEAMDLTSPDPWPLPTTIKFDRVLLLPTPRKPRVLALGLSDQSIIQELTRLRQRFLDHLSSRLDALKQLTNHQNQFQETGGQKYLPHLTIARFRPADSPKPQELSALVQGGLEFPVSLVQLYLSFAGRPEAQRPRFNQLFGIWKKDEVNDQDSGNQYPVIYRV